MSASEFPAKVSTTFRSGDSKDKQLLGVVVITIPPSP